MKQTSDLAGHLVGRERELTALEELLGSDGPARVLVLTGSPGIGKTVLWEAGVDLARRRGLRVLSARGSGAETRLSFAALIDLLDGVGPDELAGLPPPQRHALEVALFRAESTGTPPEARAIAFGLLTALRSLAAREPLLVAMDDIQWLDGASSDALAFAARRLDDEAAAFLVARRPGPPSALERALGGRAPERVEVGPLSVGAIRRILSEKFGLSLPRHVLRRVFETTLGNPLFALEVGRALAARGRPAVTDDLPVPDAVEELLETRVAQLTPRVRRMLLALALNADLNVAQLTALTDSLALEEAVGAAVVLVDGDRVRPAHPLLAAAAKTRARARERRELHLELASVVADEEARALHLALAAEHPDESLATTVAAAAAAASVRGAVHEAVGLAEHALRLTAAESPARSDRVLELAAYLEVAGEKQRVTALLAPQLDLLPAGAARVRACLLLCEGANTDDGDTQRYLRRALAESGSDPVLRSHVLAKMAGNTAVIRVERIRDAEAWALEALPAARVAGPELERRALYALAWARSLSGRAIDDVCERFQSASGAAPYLASSPERIAGQRLVWRGEIDRARKVLGRLLSLADERGEPVSYALQRLHVVELELRAGEWEPASRLLDEWAEPAERELLIWPMYERCRALLAAGRGLAAEAEPWAAEAVDRAQATGVRWDLLEGLRAYGIAALLAHEPARAVESLRPVWDHMLGEGIDDPGSFPVAPDLVEALLERGEVEEAMAVTARLRELAEQQEHPWGLASATRCGALIRLASAPYDEEAATDLAGSADAYGGLGLRFDRARTLLGLGRAQRRLKQWGAARSSLEQAAAEFDEMFSPGWAEEARSELARVGGRRPQQSGELTPAERRVAELAADGLANKEIARSLFVTVRTVEVHLKHAYTKLGIRSRTQLARRLSERV